MSRAPVFDFDVPSPYNWILDRGLVGFDPFTSLQPWHLLDKPAAFSVSERWPGLYSDGDLYAFARRQDCDDLACFVVKDGRAQSIAVIHAWTAEGFEIVEHLDSLWDWFKSVIDDVAVWAEAPEAQAARDHTDRALVSREAFFERLGRLREEQLRSIVVLFCPGERMMSGRNVDEAASMAAEKVEIDRATRFLLSVPFVETTARLGWSSFAALSGQKEERLLDYFRHLAQKERGTFPCGPLWRVAVSEPLGDVKRTFEVLEGGANECSRAYPTELLFVLDQDREWVVPAPIGATT